MKKRLEADLVSIAHRILQLKNKSDLNQLFLETQKLYEKLAVLRFVDEHYGEVRPTIGHAELETEIEALYEKNDRQAIDELVEVTEKSPIETFSLEEKAEQQEMKELQTQELIEEKSTLDAEELTAEDVNDLGDFAADITEQPLEEIQAIEEETSEEETKAEAAPKGEEEFEETVYEEEQEQETPPELKSPFELTDDTDVQTAAGVPPAMQISFEDLLGVNYSEPEFVKVNEVEVIPETVFEAVAKIEDKEIMPKKTDAMTADAKVVSLNDSFSKGINIDLNDQIAFVKHLFGNSNEDYNRVLNQLITFDNFYETRNFIEEMVKPDYNNWQGKDDYAERFMDIIEKKFL